MKLVSRSLFFLPLDLEKFFKFYAFRTILRKNGLENGAAKCNGNSEKNSPVNYIKNPYLNEDEDVLFHLTLNNKTDNLEAMFHDVKVNWCEVSSLDFL